MLCSHSTTWRRCTGAGAAGGYRSNTCLVTGNGSLNNVGILNILNGFGGGGWGGW